MVCQPSSRGGQGSFETQVACLNKQRRQSIHHDTSFDWSRHVTAAEREQLPSQILGSGETLCRPRDWEALCAHMEAGA